jgi:O-antigen biosynthesis protein
VPVAPAEERLMEPHRDPGLTNGYLPAIAFLHDAPTAVGVLDLDGPVEVRNPFGGTTWTPHRDAVVLIRRNGEPIGIVHVDVPLPEASVDWILARAHGPGGNGRSRDVLEGDHRHRSAGTAASAATEGTAPDSRDPVPGDDVSVVIATGDREAQLERCLMTICAMAEQPREVIVVDNRPSSPGTRALVTRLAHTEARLRYIAEARPGSSVARNRGIAETRAPLVAITDDDVVVDPSWLRSLVQPFADPSVLATTGLVLPLELETKAQKLFERYAGFSKGTKRRVYDMADHRAPERLLYPFWGGIFGSGNSMAFRSDWLKANRGFDPALGAGSVALAGADIDAMTHAVLDGALVYEPKAVCWHEHRRSEDAFRRQLFNYGVGLTAIFTKWLVRDSQFIRAALGSGRALRATRRRQDSTAVDAGLPRQYARVGHAGMRRGPWLYARSVRWSHRLGLEQVIEGG